MKDFNYYAPTEVVFGEKSEEKVALMVKKYGGTKVLLHYGGGSGNDIVALSQKIQRSVEGKFGIKISPEVNFV